MATKYNMRDSKKLVPIHEGKPFITSIIVRTMVDDDPDLSRLKQYKNSTNPKEQDYYIRDLARLRVYGKLWIMVGIQAEATVYIPIGNNNFMTQTITSGGLWGIESDSDKEHIDTIKKEQIDELKSYLKLFNIDIPDNVEIVEKDE